MAALTPEKLAEWVASHPMDVDGALLSIADVRGVSRLSVAALKAAAPDDPAGALWEWLQSHRLVEHLDIAVRARLPIAAPLVEASVHDASFDPQAMARFVTRTVSSRCRILRGNDFAGTGCLIGPSLVLTAWHVLGVPPGTKRIENIRVELANGHRSDTFDEPVYVSECSAHELNEEFPLVDAEYGDRRDLVVLRLVRPPIGTLGRVPLPADCRTGRVGSYIFALHWPAGNDNGVGQGQIVAVSDPSVRWRHDIRTDQGSSGGPCFDTAFDLIGVHQGKWTAAKRLVPIGGCIADLRAAVANDVAPPYLWSLDGRVDGRIVVGRDQFFEAFGLLAQHPTSTRGLRVRRRDLGGEVVGLEFTSDILARLIQRDPAAHRLLDFRWEGLEPDEFGVAQRLAAIAREAGFGVAQVPEPGIGVQDGQTTFVGTEASRAETLSDSLQSFVEDSRSLAWIVFHNPPQSLVTAQHEAFDVMVRALVRRPNLRVVVLGHETMRAADVELEIAEARGRRIDAPPAFLSEWYGGIARIEVELAAQRACTELGIDVTPVELERLATRVLRDLPREGGLVSTRWLPQIAERLQAELKDLAG